MAKMFRHSPLNSIWEGSGNVIALDILRAKKSLGVLLADIGTTRGQSADLDNYVAKLMKDMGRMANESPEELQRVARNLADRLAIALQASVLLRFGDKNIANVYIQTRICNNHGGLNYGSCLIEPSLAKAIIARNMPVY